MGEAYNAFKIGNIDIITTSTNNLETNVGTLGFHVKNIKGREFDYLSLNCEQEELKYAEVRKAISFCIDKNNIVSSVFNNKYYTTDFPLDYGSWLYAEEQSSSGYNVEQAKTTLEENGWNYKNNYWQKVINYKTVKLNLNLVVNSTNETRVQIAESIKQQIEASGIKVTIVKATDKQYNNYIQNRNYDILLTGLNLSISPDLSNFFADGNLANYKNDDMLSVLNEIKNITDTKLLKEKYDKMVQIYKQELPYIGLYSNRNVIAYSSNLMGDVTPNWYSMFYNIESWYRQY